MDASMMTKIESSQDLDRSLGARHSGKYYSQDPKERMEYSDFDTCIDTSLEDCSNLPDSTKVDWKNFRQQAEGSQELELNLTFDPHQLHDSAFVSS